MSVESIYTRVIAQGDGANTRFGFQWKFIDESDIVVYVDDALIPSSEYSLEYPITKTSGLVIFKTAPAVGAIVVIKRAVNEQQSRMFKNTAQFNANEVEKAFDKLTMLVQEQLEDIRRQALTLVSQSNIDWKVEDLTKDDVLLAVDFDAKKLMQTSFTQEDVQAVIDEAVRSMGYTVKNIEWDGSKAVFTFGDGGTANSVVSPNVAQLRAVQNEKGYYFLQWSLDGIHWNSSGAGVFIHNDLTGREAENAHPVAAITALQTAIEWLGARSSVFEMMPTLAPLNREVYGQKIYTNVSPSDFTRIPIKTFQEDDAALDDIIKGFSQFLRVGSYVVDENGTIGVVENFDGDNTLYKSITITTLSPGYAKEIVAQAGAITALQNEQTATGDQIQTIESKIPDGTSETNPLINKQQLLGETTDIREDLSGLQTQITAQAAEIAGKQDAISDLATIRSNAQAGKAASDTIATYGNIVTHNVSEFATATQGAKADTAVQPSDLATVATSGSYNDLNDKPTIPTVNNPTITFTQGGVTKGSFTLNQATDDTIALDAGGGSGSGALVIGQILEVVGTADYTPEGCLLADGAEYTKAQFPDLWANFLTGTPKLQTCTYTEYANQIAEYGFCNKFAVDTTNETFKVPTRNKYRKLVKKIVNDTSWANLYDDGWVEQGGGSGVSNATISLPVAMSDSGYTATGIVNNVSGITKEMAIQTIEKTTTTIRLASFQEGNYTMNWQVFGYAPIPDSTANITREFIVVANGTLNQAQMDWSAWASSLAGKANIDLSNTPTNVDYVVESQLPTADNGYTWYRKHKSGWVEQGGITTSDVNIPVVFPIEMRDNKYFVSLTPQYSPVYITNYQKATTTSIIVNGWNTGNTPVAGDVRWQIEGMSAQ